MDSIDIRLMVGKTNADVAIADIKDMVAIAKGECTKKKLEKNRSKIGQKDIDFLAAEKASVGFLDEVLTTFTGDGALDRWLCKHKDEEFKPPSAKLKTSRRAYGRNAVGYRIQVELEVSANSQSLINYPEDHPRSQKKRRLTQKKWFPGVIVTCTSQQQTPDTHQQKVLHLVFHDDDDKFWYNLKDGGINWQWEKK